MRIEISANREEMGESAAGEAAKVIISAIEKRGYATIVLATGTSQFEVLHHLVSHPGVDWSRVTMFHLDEYVGMTETHPASFRKYIMERFIRKVPALEAYHLIDGGRLEPLEECRRLNGIISNYQVDLAMVGIGENGHLAFNDPPADFETTDPYILVPLDEACRKQQMGEGWFETLEEVPERAISMSIRQIMKSGHIICSVPDRRKAHAVKSCLEEPVSNIYPGSILREHPNCSLYLDRDSALLLSSVKKN
ncbi:MAG TPA: glucosamine-6-phosphate deaminase [Bacteroides sp.]|nr:glucosamine-6-phosphate deaminase [Bacteroides sp.]